MICGLCGRGLHALFAMLTLWPASFLRTGCCVRSKNVPSKDTFLLAGIPSWIILELIENASALPLLQLWLYDRRPVMAVRDDTRQPVMASGCRDLVRPMDFGQHGWHSPGMVATLWVWGGPCRCPGRRVCCNLCYVRVAFLIKGLFFRPLWLGVCSPPLYLYVSMYVLSLSSLWISFVCGQRP